MSADEILAWMLTLGPNERVAVVSAIRFNGIFCAECGTGSAERPNHNCYCLADE